MTYRFNVFWRIERGFFEMVKETLLEISHETPRPSLRMEVGYLDG